MKLTFILLVGSLFAAAILDLVGTATRQPLQEELQILAAQRHDMTLAQWQFSNPDLPEGAYENYLSDQNSRYSPP